MRGTVDAIYEHCSASIREVDEHTLFVTVGGDAREEDIEPFFEIFQPLLEELTPVRVLVDATYLRDTTLAVRWGILKRIRANKPFIERSAIFGLTPRLEALLWIVFTLSGRSNIRTFLWRHEAEAWLRADPIAGED
jgi:hypothetical protein